MYMYIYISLDVFLFSASNGKSVSTQRHIFDFIQIMCIDILYRYIRMLNKEDLSVLTGHHQTVEHCKN